MQFSTEASLRAVSSRSSQNSGTRRKVMCRVEQPSDSGGVRHTKGLADLGLALLPSYEVATWLVPALIAGIASYATLTAGFKGSSVILLPILASGVGTVAVTLAKPPSAEWKAFAGRTLIIEVQQRDADGTFNRISTFETPTLSEVLKHTRNNTGLLKPFLMQCSDLLRGCNPDEVKVFGVGREGLLIRYIEGEELLGILKITEKFVVRI